MQPLTRMSAPVRRQSLRDDTRWKATRHPEDDGLVKAEIGVSLGFWQRQRSTLGPDRNKRGWRQQVELDASDPFVAAGRRANAME